MCGMCLFFALLMGLICCMGVCVSALKYSFAPVVRQGCAVLLLGSLPGDASLQQAEYYAHPRNVFWRLMGELCAFSPELPYERRLACLNAAGIALWDVVRAGRREGSSDANIREVLPNDIPALLRVYGSIRAICCNGGAAFRLLRRFYGGGELWSRYQVLQLPSTSPAAARLGYAEKLCAYRAALVPLLPLGRLARG